MAGERLLQVSDEDLSTLREMLADFRNRRDSPSSRYLLPPDDLSTPEIYLARTPVGGIAGTSLEIGTGTGTGTVDQRTFSSALCQIYRQIGPSLATDLISMPGVVRRVYNISTTDIEQGIWVVVARDKAGHWYVVRAATDGGDSSSAVFGAHARINLNGTNNVPSGSPATQLTGFNLLFDGGGFFDIGDPDGLYLLTPGTYLVGGQVFISSTTGVAAGNKNVWMEVQTSAGKIEDSRVWDTGFAGEGVLNASGLFQTGGEVIRMAFGWQGGAGTININANAKTFLWAQYLGEL